MSDLGATEQNKAHTEAPRLLCTLGLMLSISPSQHVEIAPSVGGPYCAGHIACGSRRALWRHIGVLIVPICLYLHGEHISINAYDL
jgi:hypothetical protein